METFRPQPAPGDPVLAKMKTAGALHRGYLWPFKSKLTDDEVTVGPDLAIKRNGKVVRHQRGEIARVVRMTVKEDYQSNGYGEPYRIDHYVTVRTFFVSANGSVLLDLPENVWSADVVARIVAAVGLPVEDIPGEQTRQSASEILPSSYGWHHANPGKATLLAVGAAVLVFALIVAIAEVT